ncbi:unnamed protein product [Gongylonema pulchrum]|uniref:CTP_synth_N domain-containing protein n=1 Tax=Gongylonema pulchrum TaxID=637853 RepID=A0A183CXX8_9BILA|nr:unnamed protein product [Gongylonema pulchrum]
MDMSTSNWSQCCWALVDIVVRLFSGDDDRCSRVNACTFVVVVDRSSNHCCINSLSEVFTLHLLIAEVNSEGILFLRTIRKVATPVAAAMKPVKMILVTGGVISGVGKGVISSSLGALLKAYGYRVSVIKIDPYINIDAGTFSPFEHGT